MDHQQECKICDKHVVKLAQHVRQAHDMNMAEYYDNMSDTETESNESNKIEYSEASEIETEDAPSSDDKSASDEDESVSDEITREKTKESDSDEAKQTFFEFLLKNIENCKELTEQEIFQQLAKNTYWFLNAKKSCKK